MQSLTQIKNSLPPNLGTVVQELIDLGALEILFQMQLQEESERLASLSPLSDEIGGDPHKFMLAYAEIAARRDLTREYLRVFSAGAAAKDKFTRNEGV